MISFRVVTNISTWRDKETAVKALAKEMKGVEYSIHIIPGCTKKTSRKWMAIVDFKSVLPSFLQDHHNYTSPNGIHFDRDFLGFTQLYPTTTSGDGIVADIIVVPGLGSHAFGSWVGRKTGKMWLRDFLKEDLPDCRVLLYGYDSKLGNRSTDNILSFGDTFMANLDGIRRDRVVGTTVLARHSYSVKSDKLARRNRDQSSSLGIALAA
jgi:hypothetical protein